jgi:uncharacterized protein YukE
MEKQMTGFLGMDIQAVRSLATQLQAKADEIDAIANALSSHLNNVQWVGHDADVFRNDWQTTHRTQLSTVASALRDASHVASANATQQEQTSAS